MIGGFDVRLEVERTVAEGREQRLQVGDAAVATSGTFSGQYSCDVSRAADVAVVCASAPVESHATVASTVYQHHLVGRTLHLQRLFQAVFALYNSRTCEHLTEY